MQNPLEVPVPPHGGGAVEGNVVAFRRLLDPEREAPLSGAELRVLRRLLAIAARIERSVDAVEVISTACPTFRREVGPL